MACSWRVSPKSRSRKPVKTGQRRHPAGRGHLAGPGRLREPRLRAAYDAIIGPMRDLADPARVPDAFAAEVMVSVLVGMVFQAGLAAALQLQASIDAFLWHGRPPGADRKDETYGELCASLSIAATAPPRWRAGRASR